jgi:hypothetical protein
MKLSLIHHQIFGKSVGASRIASPLFFVLLTFKLPLKPDSFTEVLLESLILDGA